MTQNLAQDVLLDTFFREEHTGGMWYEVWYIHQDCEVCERFESLDEAWTLREKIRRAGIPCDVLACGRRQSR